MTQTSMPAEQEALPPVICAWCGASPAWPYEIEPARYGKAANGVRVVKRAARTMPACPKCTSGFRTN